MDFRFDATAEGRRLKFLNVIDEHSRLCLAIRVGRPCKTMAVVTVLEELASLYPSPAFIRRDNGPEFNAHALRKWCQSSGTSTAYIEPGAPWQNGFAESINSRFRDESLNIADWIGTDASCLNSSRDVIFTASHCTRRCITVLRHLGYINNALHPKR